MHIKIGKISKLIFWIISVFIIMYAIYIRGFYYLKNIPFWGDDMLLAQSICEQDIWKSFTHIYGMQKAPPIFVFFTYLNTLLFGFKEWVLRLIPFIAGILSVILFFILSLKVFKSKISIITAMLMFALNGKLIYYAQEFKQYSFDLFMCLLVLLSYNYVNIEDFNLKNYKKIIFYLVVVFLIMISSFPAAFAIFAVLTLKTAEHKQFPKGLVVIGIGILGTCTYIINLFRHVLPLEITEPVWLQGFISFSPSVVYNVFEKFMQFNDLNNILFMICLFIGILICAVEKSKQAKLIFIFFLYACFASLIHIYPISSRAALYLIPVFIIFIVKPLEIGNYNNKNLKIISYIKSIILMAVIISTIMRVDVTKEYNVIIYKDYNYRINNKNDYLNLIKNYNSDDLLMANIEFNSWLSFYNKDLGYNRDFKTTINQLGDGTSYKEFLENVRTFLEKSDKTKNIYLAFLIMEGGYNPFQENDIENIIKELNLEYQKLNCNIQHNKIWKLYTISHDK